MSNPDNNYRSYADKSHFVVSDETISPENPSQYDDVLKISCCKDAEFHGCIINPNGGNREDGVDIMRYCEHVVLIGCGVGCGGKYAFTIKGGSDQITLSNVTVIGEPGSEGVDIDIGNFSSTVPNAKTGTVYLEQVTHQSGRAVRVRVGWASRPVITGGNVRVLFWQSIELKFYVLIKRVCSFITSRL